MKRGMLALAIWAFSNVAIAKPLVVLVPGFFNSLAPGTSQGPYFSSAIVRTISQRAQVLVVDNLSPVGGVQENAGRLLQYLKTVEKHFPNQPMTLITHSAGGLYALQALNLDPRLPVKTVVTLAAPYEGIDFIENLDAHVPGLDSLAHYLRLDALKEFRLAKTHVLMNHLHIPSHVRWIALAGMQSKCFLVTCAESKRLSWVLSLSQDLMKGPSDGIVTVTSALAEDLNLLDENGHAKTIERWSSLIPLEHWEMVEEASLFHLIGVLDTGSIEREQVELYSHILAQVL